MNLGRLRRRNIVQKVFLTFPYGCQEVVGPISINFYRQFWRQCSSIQTLLNTRKLPNQMLKLAMELPFVLEKENFFLSSAEKLTPMLASFRRKNSLHVADPKIKLIKIFFFYYHSLIKISHTESICFFQPDTQHATLCL